MEEPVRLKCPNCGYQMEPRKPELWPSLLFWLLLVVLGLIIWVISDRLQ